MTRRFVMAASWLVTVVTAGCEGSALPARGDGGSETRSADTAAADTAAADTGTADTGAAAAPGPAGAPVVNVCGCGCCGGGPERTACYYPALGQSGSGIPDPRPADCSTIGCSAGVRHVCCADPGIGPGGGAATYCASSPPIGSFVIVVTKTEGATCTTLSVSSSGGTLSWPVTVTSPSPVLAASGATRGPCDRSTADPSRAAGAIGTVGVSQLGSSASITVHATLFFADATGTITAVRMDADDLSFAAIACPPP